jgi:flagellar hook assembly protein FlgD
VYDSAGRLLRVLVDGERAAGEHELSWNGRSADGRELPSGIYLCELRAGGERQVRKLVLAR